MPASTDKIVPEPHLRANLIRATHLDNGHYGIKKTYSLLEPVYVWAGMYEQVRFEVRACAVCDRVKASFEVRDTILKPLSIMGLFYRWGVDLCKMPHTSEDGNKYVVVMIEHFTKWVELVPIPEKSFFYTATALKGVLTRFGAPAKVLTDQGEEFQGEFAALLQKLLINHRTTSRDHPQSDGLAERMVKVVKEALRKYCITFNKQHWCCFLCWIAMGYRMSRQRSLGGYSPYFLLFGRWPIVVGASVRDVLQKVVDLDSPEEWARLVNERAKVFERHMPIAFNNLAVAQHRDMLRYTKTRSGTLAPKLQRFVAGDFVYLKRQKADSLDPRVGRLVLRVKSVGSGGRLVLEGRDKKLIRDHVENCAPCHHPNLYIWQNPKLACGDVDHGCPVCRLTTGGSTMLLCDGGDKGWHKAC
jgi:hypothetical protein